MPAATPIYGFPYPVLGDPPHGPNQIEDLAEAVEAALADTDADVAALVAADLTHMRLINGGRRTTDTAPIDAIETVFATSGALSLPAASTILVRGTANVFVSVGATEYHFRLRETNIGGAVVKEDFSGGGYAAGVPYEFSFTYLYRTGAAEPAKTWVASVQRNGATGSIVAQLDSRVEAFYLGSSSLIPVQNP